MSDSNSDSEDKRYDVMQLFASDNEEDFSGFSNPSSNHDEQSHKKKIPSVVVIPDSGKQNSSKSCTSEVNKPSTSRGPGKGPGKNRKGKAPAKRKNDVEIETSRPKKSKQDETEFNRLYNMLEQLLDSQNNNLAQSNAPQSFEPEVPEEGEGFDIESVNFDDFDIFGNDVDANNNNMNEAAVAEDIAFEYDLPKIFEDDEKYGAETTKSVASLIGAVVKKKSNVNDLVKENKVPINCKGLFPPRVNPEIWGFLQRIAKSDDLLFQGIQKVLGLGIVPVIRLAEMLAKNDPIDKNAMRDNVSKALSVLCSAFFELSYARRMLLKPHMDAKYHQLCTKNLETSEFLFGDDISKRVKDISDAHKLKGAVSGMSGNLGGSKNYPNLGLGSGYRGNRGKRYPRGYRGGRSGGSRRRSGRRGGRNF